MNNEKKVMVGAKLDFVDTDMISIPVSAGTITQINLSLSIGLSGRFVVSLNGVHTLINQFVDFDTKAFYPTWTYNLSADLKEPADLVCYFYTETHGTTDDIRVIHLSYQQVI